MEKFIFREVRTTSGVPLFEAENDEARDLMEFLRVTKPRMSEEQYDKIFEWLTKLGHDVYTLTAHPRAIDF